MLGEAWPAYLKTVVREVDHVVLIVQIVLSGACSQIALLVHINSEVTSDQGPHSHVKLSVIVKQGPFDIFLHDPVSLLTSRKDVVLDILQVAENCNVASSIERARLNDPHVLFTMLLRQFFSLELLAGELSMVHDQLVHLVCAHRMAFNQESRRCRFEYCVMGPLRRLTRLVVVSEGLDEAIFCADTLVRLEMIE